MLKELDRVRVVYLETPTRDTTGTERVRRLPRVGDLGTIVSLLAASVGPPRYSVECVDENGLTIWLTDFGQNEIAAEPEGAA